MQTIKNKYSRSLNAMKEYGFIDYKVYVRSLNVIVEPNREPVLTKPFNPNINPTITNDVYEINAYLKKSLSIL